MRRAANRRAVKTLRVTEGLEGRHLDVVPILGAIGAVAASPDVGSGGIDRLGFSVSVIGVS
jgi:hypothetical protein